MSEHVPLQLQRLAEDPDTSDVIELIEELKEKLQSAIEVRGETIQKLRDFRDEINTSCYRANASKTAGSVAGIVGGVVCVVGVSLMPVTGGLSALAVIPGGILGAAGGTVSVGADVGHFVHAKIAKKSAEEQIKLEQEQLEKISSLGKRINLKVDHLVAKHHAVEPDVIFDYILMLGRCGKFMFKGYKLVDTCMDVGRVAIATRRTVGANVSVGQALAKSCTMFIPGARANQAILKAFKVMDVGGDIGRAVQKGYKVVKPLTGALGGVLLALDVIAIPIDFFFMINSSIEVHRYRKGRLISDAAKKLEEAIQRLEETKSDLQEQLDNWIH